MPISVPPPSASRRRHLRQKLLAWYDRCGRDLPWRNSGDPYRVLVSEFMLQQTQVATVLPYYERFLERFPTLRDLARAPEERVRAAWSGLGYYRRAASLRAAATAILEDHDGRFPDRLDALRALPGVGDYTAAALASIVHGIPKAVVDGNVIRVLTRWAGMNAPVDRTPARAALAALADTLLEPARPGDWNQAVMELGATVCTPRAPRCGECPWRGSCTARREGNPERYPVKGAARKSVAVERAVGILRRGEAMLLVRRRDPKLLDRTWEFPGVEVEPGVDPRAALAAALEALFGKGVRVGSELAQVKHSITHRRITLRGFEAEIRPLPVARGGERKWVEGETILDLPRSSSTLKLYRRVSDSRSHSTYRQSASRSPGSRKRS